MGGLNKLLQEISEDNNAKLWDLARLYKSYKDIAVNPAAKHQFESYLGTGLAKAFDEISRIPGGPQKMEELAKTADKWDSMAKIGAATGKANPVNPADLWMKQKDNVASGVIGAGFQLFGQLLYPNDPQKATALGEIGKTIGEVVSNTGKGAGPKPEARDYGKPNLLSKQLVDQQVNSAKGPSGQKGLGALLKEIDSQGSSKDFSKPQVNKADANKADGNKATDFSKDVGDF
jgi:hypothetical protein